MTPFYQDIPAVVKFEKYDYIILAKEDTLPVEKLESLNVLDVNRYKKQDLKEKIGDFIRLHDYQKIKENIQKIKINHIER